MKDDSVYLGHILRCISRIEEYVAGGRETLSSSQLVHDAVLRGARVGCVIDESGEGYLYPDRLFVAIEVPRAASRAFRAAS